MQALFIIVSVGLVGGIAIGLQSPMSSMLGNRLGMMEGAFIVHFSGAVAASIPLLVWSGGNLSKWREVPWYTLGAGAFGLIVVSALSFIIPKVGVAPAVILLVLGQLVVGAVLDHFGLLGAAVRPLTAQRLLGLSVVMLGVWLTVR